MHPFEQYHHSYSPEYSFDEEDIKQEPFMSNIMDSFSAYDPVAFSSAMFADGQQDFKYDMLRSMSQNMHQTHAEAAPSLLSSASASSSTVGSPYCGHAQPVVSQYAFANHYLPAIADDSFQYYESSHFDHEAISQDAKLTGPYVGKSADLSSFALRSSTMPVQELAPSVPLVSSPLSITATPSSVNVQSKRRRSSDEAAQIASSATSISSQKTRDDSVFKSPTTPASAYPKATFSSPNATRTTRPAEFPPSQDSFHFSYSYPFSSHQPMQQHGPISQYHFFPRSNGNPRLRNQVSYPVQISGQQSPFLNASYGAYQVPQQQPHFSPAPSPAPSTHSYHAFSQPVTVENFGTQHASMRRQSIGSIKSAASPHSYSADEDSATKGQCPYPDCGRTFKDLKAHMMTHETIRPEKCPIISCEYNKKGFSRKYDKNRHTLTHYRGTMVCGFCPGSGSSLEKSFNRADVFKRHLTGVHGVEQTAPNSRKRSPSKSNVKLSSYCQDATGKCSTCAATFNNAQEFYEHLDDCVLKVVQQEDPAEAINAQCLAEVANDVDLQATFERNHIKAEDSAPSMEDDDEDEDDEEDDEDEDEFDFNERSGKGSIRATKVTSNRPIIGGNISKKTSKKGLTWSKGGGSIVGKSRKRRKFYPPSWGMATDKMNMKKRVLCVYDGQRRLLKDDMMMHNEFEVRLPLLHDANSYVTDLDLETMKRAQAFHNATPEEKGPWIPEQDFLQEFLQ